MPRKSAATDFPISVEGVGQFTFAKRTMRDEISIQVEFARIIDGVEPTTWLNLVGNWLSTLRVLTVRAPEGWDLDGLDPQDPETYANLGRVYQDLSDKESSFRRKPGEAGQAERAGSPQNA